MAELSRRPLLSTALDRKLFVDRSKELDRLLKDVQLGFNALVVGNRGSGKTSLLRRFANRLERESSVTPVLVEGTDLAQDAAEFLSLVAYRLRRRPAMVSALPNMSLTRPRPLSATEQTLEALSELSTVLGEYDDRVVLIVDELIDSSIGHTVFGRLRDELWSLGAIWLVGCDSQSRAMYLRPPADTFFEDVLELEPLTEDDAFKLLRARISKAEAPDKVLRAIVAESDRSPRDLISSAAQVVLDKRKPRELASERAGVDKLLADLGEPARRLYEALDDSGPASASDEQLLRTLGWSRGRVTQLLGPLKEAGLVEEHEGGGEGPGRRRKLYKATVPAGKR